MSPSQELYEKAREALEEVLKESPIRYRLVHEGGSVAAYFFHPRYGLVDYLRFIPFDFLSQSVESMVRAICAHAKGAAEIQPELVLEGNRGMVLCGVQALAVGPEHVVPADWLPILEDLPQDQKARLANL